MAAPLEDTYAFDVEVLVPAGSQPILAAAVSKEAWYSWAAAHLVDEAAAAPPGPSCGPGGVVSPSQLIPVGEGARLIFGHNVSYDRARAREQYARAPASPTRFLDTMSLHIAVSGEWLVSQYLPYFPHRRKKRHFDR